MKSNKPKVSFMEDSLFWESSILYNVVDRVKSYSLSRSVETEEKSGYKYIHYGDIHTGVAQIVSKSSILPSINLGNYEFLEKGDLILADASEDYQGIAKPAVIIDTLPYKLVAGLHTIALRPKNLDSLFLYYTFYSRDFRRHGYRTGTGMKVFGISTSNLLKYELKYPSKEVQSQIGRFFKNLDDTISLHQQELEALKQTKQGFLQKMFPNDGEGVPEFRFAGFTGDWVQRSLGEIGEVVTGSTPSTANNDYYCGKFLFVSPADIQSNRYVEATNTTLSKSGFDKGRKIKSGSTLFVSIGSTIGKVAQVSKEVITNQQINSVIPNTGMDKDFVFSLLEKNSKIIKNLSSTQAVPIINKNTFSNINVMHPTLEEQIKIGKFFRKLDEVIELKEKEIEALKETKKGFLQKMFV